MSISTNKKAEFINDQSHQELGLFLSRNNSSFQQTNSWADFKKKTGSNIYMYGLKNYGELVIAGVFIESKLPFNKTYLYSPKGPVLKDPESQKLLSLYFENIKNVNPNAIFIRIEPEIELPSINLPIEKTIDIQPSKTILLDLKNSEDDLLKVMHHKTRYNIRLSRKKGVTIEKGKALDFDAFWSLLEDTSARDGFRLHDKEYYKTMVDYLKERSNPQIKIYFAKYNNQPIATGLFAFSGDTVTYVHGASSSEHRNLMAPFLLQWTLIVGAKARGYKYYDFFGIDEVKWPGVTRFKRGFSGKEVSHPGTFDVVTNKSWYSVYKLIRGLKRK